MRQKRDEFNGQRTEFAYVEAQEYSGTSCQNAILVIGKKYLPSEGRDGNYWIRIGGVYQPIGSKQQVLIEVKSRNEVVKYSGTMNKINDSGGDIDFGYEKDDVIYAFKQGNKARIHNILG